MGAPQWPRASFPDPAPGSSPVQPDMRLLRARATSDANAHDLFSLGSLCDVGNARWNGFSTPFVQIGGEAAFTHDSDKPRTLLCARTQKSIETEFHNEDGKNWPAEQPVSSSTATKRKNENAPQRLLVATTNFFLPFPPILPKLSLASLPPFLFSLSPMYSLLLL